MNTSLRTILWIATFVGISSCTIKKRVYLKGYYIDWLNFAVTNPNPTKYKFVSYSLNAYNALSTKQAQESIINASEPNEIYCNEGTVVQFPNDAFVYEDGKAIKCTKVAVYITEFYSMSDILESGLTTTSNKRTLFSSGMVYIEASCHGEKLKLKPGKTIAVSMPTNMYDDKMKVFSGKLRDGIVDWKVNGKVSNTSITTPTNSEEGDSLQFGDGFVEGGTEYFRIGTKEYQDAYLMTTGKLGWINCDRFYDTKNPTNLLVKVDSVEKTSVALIFKQMKSVLPGYQYTNNTTEFKGIPIGEEISILAYRINEKTKLAIVGKHEMTVGDTSVVQLSMESMPLAEFKSMLKEYN